MPCAIRSPNIVFDAHSASTCSGYVSHVSAAKLTMSASVIVRPLVVNESPTSRSSR